MACAPILFVGRFDDLAATTEEPARAIAEYAAAHDQAVGAAAPWPPLDFEAFQQCYRLAGTPTAQIKRCWRADEGVLILTFMQHTPATPGQPASKPTLPTPMRLALIEEEGKRLAFCTGDDPQVDAIERLVLLNNAVRILCFALSLPLLPPLRSPCFGALRTCVRWRSSARSRNCCICSRMTTVLLLAGMRASACSEERSSLALKGRSVSRSSPVC